MSGPRPDGDHNHYARRESLKASKRSHHHLHQQYYPLVAAHPQENASRSPSDSLDRPGPSQDSPSSSTASLTIMTAAAQPQPAPAPLFTALDPPSHRQHHPQPHPHPHQSHSHQPYPHPHPHPHQPYPHQKTQTRSQRLNSDAADSRRDDADVLSSSPPVPAASNSRLTAPKVRANGVSSSWQYAVNSNASPPRGRHSGSSAAANTTSLQKTAASASTAPLDRTSATSRTSSLASLDRTSASFRNSPASMHRTPSSTSHAARSRTPSASASGDRQSSLQALVNKFNQTPDEVVPLPRSKANAPRVSSSSSSNTSSNYAVPRSFQNRLPDLASSSSSSSSPPPSSSSARKLDSQRPSSRQDQIPRKRSSATPNAVSRKTSPSRQSSTSGSRRTSPSRQNSTGASSSASTIRAPRRSHRTSAVVTHADVTNSLDELVQTQSLNESVQTQPRNDYDHVNASQYPAPGDMQPPLFGEISGVDGSVDLGHGRLGYPDSDGRHGFAMGYAIPRAQTQPPEYAQTSSRRRRRGSDGSMHRPGAMFRDDSPEYGYWDSSDAVPSISQHHSAFNQSSSNDRSRHRLPGSRSRSGSRSRDVSPSSPSAWYRGVTPSLEGIDLNKPVPPKSSNGHRRSRSDMSSRRSSGRSSMLVAYDNSIPNINVGPIRNTSYNHAHGSGHSHTATSLGQAIHILSPAEEQPTPSPSPANSPIVAQNAVSTSSQLPFRSSHTHPSISAALHDLSADEAHAASQKGLGSHDRIGNNEALSTTADVSETEQTGSIEDSFEPLRRSHTTAGYQYHYPEVSPRTGAAHYSPRSARHDGSDMNLERRPSPQMTAIIADASAPLKSPPLRSSRPRQSVSNANNSAAAARERPVADAHSAFSTPSAAMKRHSMMLTTSGAGLSEGPYSADRPVGRERRRPQEGGTVDFAARRQFIQQAFTRSMIETEKEEERKRMSVLQEQVTLAQPNNSIDDERSNSINTIGQRETFLTPAEELDESDVGLGVTIPSQAQAAVPSRPTIDTKSHRHQATETTSAAHDGTPAPPLQNADDLDGDSPTLGTARYPLDQGQETADSSLVDETQDVDSSLAEDSRGFDSSVLNDSPDEPQSAVTAGSAGTFFDTDPQESARPIHSPLTQAQPPAQPTLSDDDQRPTPVRFYSSDPDDAESIHIVLGDSLGEDPVDLARHVASHGGISTDYDSDHALGSGLPHVTGGNWSDEVHNAAKSAWASAAALHANDPSLTWPDVEGAAVSGDPSTAAVQTPVAASEHLSAVGGADSAKRGRAAFSSGSHRRHGSTSTEGTYDGRKTSTSTSNSLDDETAAATARSTNETLVHSSSQALSPQSGVSLLSAQTMDSESYGTINRVLDAYHDTNMIAPEHLQDFPQHLTPERMQDFQQRLFSQSPGLARAGGWDPKKVTQLYLQGLRGAKAGSAPSQAARSPQAAPPTPAKDDQPPTPIRRADADVRAIERKRIGTPPSASSTNKASQPASPPASKASKASADATSSGVSATTRGAAALTVPQRQLTLNRASLNNPDDFNDNSPSFMDWIHHQADDTPTDEDAKQKLERALAEANRSSRLVLPDIPRGGLGIIDLNVEPLSSDGTVEPPRQASPRCVRQPIDVSVSPTRKSKHSTTLAPASDNTLHNNGRTSPADPSERKRGMISPADKGSLPPTPTDQPPSPDEADAAGNPKTSVSTFSELTRTETLASTTASTRTATLSADDQKKLSRRQHILRELVDTESSFGQDMTVVVDIYKGTSNVILDSKEDARTLFGNAHDIVAFSMRFLDALKTAVRPVYTLSRSKRWRTKRDSAATNESRETDDQASETGDGVQGDLNEEERDRLTSIGSAFQECMGEMEKVYTEYLKNHDAANQKLQQLQKLQKVQIWLKECQIYANDLTTAWDLDSLLVKPVQRLLKYSLFLKDLLEVTPENHPDFFRLDTVAREMVVVSVRINEAKKRADLLEQVAGTSRGSKRKENESRLALSKRLLNIRPDRFKPPTGLVDSYQDRDYNAIADKFGSHFFQLQVVMRDVEMYVEEVQGWVQRFVGMTVAIEAFIDVGQTTYPECESKWRRFRQALREAQVTALADHLAAVRKSVIEPMATTLRLYDEPQKFMEKRKKRIVDYAKYKQMKEKGDRPDKKTSDQGEQFLAINETLKDELPQLYSLTGKLVFACLTTFVQLQLQWQSLWKRRLLHAIEIHDVPESFVSVFDDFAGDFRYPEAQVLSLGICNGSLLADAANFVGLLTPTSTQNGLEDADEPHTAGPRRPSTQNTMEDRDRPGMIRSPSHTMAEWGRARGYSSGQTPPLSGPSAADLTRPGDSHAAAGMAHVAMSRDPSYVGSSSAAAGSAVSGRRVRANSHQAGHNRSPNTADVNGSSWRAVQAQLQAAPNTAGGGGGIGTGSRDERPAYGTRTATAPIVGRSLDSGNMGAHNNRRQVRSGEPDPSQANHAPSTLGAGNPTSSTLGTSNYPPISSTGNQPSSSLPGSQTAMLRSVSSSGAYSHAMPGSSTSAAAPLALQTQQRFSGIFSSAMPMADSPVEGSFNADLPSTGGSNAGLGLSDGAPAANSSSHNARPTSSNAQRPRTPRLSTSGSLTNGIGQPSNSSGTAPGSSHSVSSAGAGAGAGVPYHVLFLAASVYEFNIDRARREAGYPYLTYGAGEIFDVIGEKGELWLAKNQDDATHEIGWIWNKHFAKLAS